jgi:hypothetical protein
MLLFWGGLLKAIYPKTHHYYSEPHAGKINGGKKAINNIRKEIASQNCLLVNKACTSLKYLNEAKTTYFCISAHLAPRLQIPPFAPLFSFTLKSLEKGLRDYQAWKSEHNS